MTIGDEVSASVGTRDGAANLFIAYAPEERRAEALKKAIAETGSQCIAIDDFQDAFRKARRSQRENPVLILCLAEEDVNRLASALLHDLEGVTLVLICARGMLKKTPEDIRAFSFLAIEEPFSSETTKSIVMSAGNQARRKAAGHAKQTQLLGAIKCAETAKFEFRTLPEAEMLAEYLSHAFPDRSRAGKGLWELMSNAVEHGNLEIGFKEKARLLEAGALQSEIARRLSSERYGSRRASVVMARKENGVYVIIKDEGPGFAWREFTKFSPARASYKNGRGIQLARITCFESLAYNDAGNQVSVFSPAGAPGSYRNTQTQAENLEISASAA